MIRCIGVCVIGSLVFGCSGQNASNPEVSAPEVEADIGEDQRARPSPDRNPVPEKMGNGVSPSQRSDPAKGIHDALQDASATQPLVSDYVGDLSPTEKPPKADDDTAAGIPKGRQAPIDGDDKAKVSARDVVVPPTSVVTRVPSTHRPTAPETLPTKALEVPPTNPVPNPQTVVATADILLPSGVRVRVSGSIFRGGGRPGDFDWMIQQEQYARTLFVYNDNEEQFDAFRRGDRPSGCSVGGGNGVIRPYQCLTPPKAIGVPTGSRGVGYTALAGHAKTKIDQAIASIRTLAETGNYDAVIFSQAAGERTLGAGIFRVSQEVTNYIFESLLRLNSS